MHMRYPLSQLPELHLFQWNYLRVKREKQTIFLVCEMTETVDAAKAKLCQIIASSGGGDQLVSTHP